VNRLLWVDLEMSGLDVHNCRILEVAAIVTDRKFEELETYHAIVKQDQAVLDAMDDWCTRQHGQSGLTVAVPDGQPEVSVEDDLLALVDRHWKKSESPILCGNSIGTDRDFIRAWMPRLALKLHYRILDVSSYKVIFKELYGVGYAKGGNHRAVDDIRESIGELKHYLSFLDAARLPVAP
jgi:oligoribonuclease